MISRLRDRARVTLAVVAGMVISLNACGDELDRTPEKIDGTESTEFEAADIERAENASDAVKDYCSGADSEAQYIGCISHVDESEIP